MSEPIDNGGEAFPRTIEIRTVTGSGGLVGVEQVHVPGMGLRDWFAGMAMQAMVSCYRDTLMPDKDKLQHRWQHGSVSRDLLIDRNGVTGECDGANEVASDAYIIADSMIAEKRRTEGGAE